MPRLAPIALLPVVLGVASCGNITEDPEPPTTMADRSASTTARRATTSSTVAAAPADRTTRPTVADYPVEVPDVVGLSLDEARAQLTAEGIPVQVFPSGARYPQDCGPQEGQYVEGQSPEAGTTLEPSLPGSWVELRTIVCISRQP